MTLMTTSRDGQALLDAILDEPEDDLHRLVYADWLEETGDDPRARNIRHQIERAKDGIEWEARPSTDADHLALLGLLLGEPLAGLADSEASMALVPEARPVAVLSRGFVREVHLGHDLFVAHAQVVFCRHPVERVVLTDKRPHTFPAHDVAFWYDGGAEPQRLTAEWYVARELYDGLGDGKKPGWSGKGFPVSEVAAALERACLLFGLALRKKAREERCR